MNKKISTLVRADVPPKTEEQARVLQEFQESVKATREQHRLAAIVALQALERLVDVLQYRCGQPYKLRSLLYSLWNGKPAQLTHLLSLDWQIRQDMCALMLGFGYEDREVQCFYKAIENAVRSAGQWEWFLEERCEYQKLEEYANLSKRVAQAVGMVPPCGKEGQ